MRLRSGEARSEAGRARREVYNRRACPPSSPERGSPDSSLTDEKGSSVSPPSGETLYAVFKTTCPTCELTWPYLERLRAPPRAGLPIVAVSQDDPKATRAFAERLATRLETAYDPRAVARLRRARRRDGPDASSASAPDGTIAETVVGFDRARMEGLAPPRRRARRPAAARRSFAPDEDVPAAKPG